MDGLQLGVDDLPTITSRWSVKAFCGKSAKTSSDASSESDALRLACATIRRRIEKRTRTDASRRIGAEVPRAKTKSTAARGSSKAQRRRLPTASWVVEPEPTNARQQLLGEQLVASETFDAFDESGASPEPRSDVGVGGVVFPPTQDAALERTQRLHSDSRATPGKTRPADHAFDARRATTESPCDLSYGDAVTSGSAAM